VTGFLIGQTVCLMSRKSATRY